MDNHNILDMLTEEMQKRLGKHLKKIIIFGSRARGDHDPESDYDILVVLDEMSHEIKDMIDEIGGDALYNHNAVCALMPVTEKTIEDRPYEPFLMNAFKEGIVCYESS